MTRTASIRAASKTAELCNKDCRDGDHLVERKFSSLHATETTAEALVKILNSKRTPLSFELQSLALRLADEGYAASRWTRTSSAEVMLVAKSVLLRASRRTPADGEIVENVRADTTGVLASDRLKTMEEVVVVVVDEDELGRSPPFRILSSTTILKSSFTVPSSLLVEDVRRRRGKVDPCVEKKHQSGWTIRKVMMLLLIERFPQRENYGCDRRSNPRLQGKERLRLARLTDIDAESNWTSQPLPP